MLAEWCQRAVRGDFHCQEFALSAALRSAGIACIGMAITVCALLSLFQLATRLSRLATQPATSTLAMSVPRLLPQPASIETPRTQAVQVPQARIRTVMIPPIPPPLAATAFGGLPAVVAPAS